MNAQCKIFEICSIDYHNDSHALFDLWLEINLFYSNVGEDQLETGT